MIAEWKKCRLGEIGLVVTGKTPSSRNPEHWGSAMPFVTPTDFDSYNKNIRNAIRHLSNSGIDEFRGKVLPTKSIIVTCIGSQMGKVAINEVECVTNQQINSIIPEKDFNADYIYYVLSSMQSYLRNLATGGSTMPIVNKSTFENITIDVPDLPTQTAIAKILSSLDDKIELNNKINQELETLAQTIFKHWFIDFEFPMSAAEAAAIGKPELEGKPYKSSGGKMVESGLGEIPKRWNVTTLSQHIEATRGLSYKGNGLADETSGIPMVNLNSVYEGGGYKYEGLKYYSGDYKERHTIKPGDLAFANTEQGHKYLLIGYPGVVPNSIGSEALFSHHIYRVRTIEQSPLTNQFIYYLTLQPMIREQIIGAANGTTVNMLKIDGLQTPKFVEPSVESCRSFTSIIQNIWQLKESNQHENGNLSKLRDTLLPKLISGELEVNAH